MSDPEKPATDNPSNHSEEHEQHGCRLGRVLRNAISLYADMVGGVEGASIDGYDVTHAIAHVMAEVLAQSELEPCTADQINQRVTTDDDRLRIFINDVKTIKAAAMEEIKKALAARERGDGRDKTFSPQQESLLSDTAEKTGAAEVKPGEKLVAPINPAMAKDKRFN